jgi:hypothetical protein
MFTYDLCLLITIIKTAFNIIRIQTNNILILKSKKFNIIKNKKLTKAKFNAKPKKLFF